MKSKGRFHCGHGWLPSQGPVPWSSKYAVTEVGSRRTGYVETFACLPSLVVKKSREMGLVAMEA